MSPYYWNGTRAYVFDVSCTNPGRLNNANLGDIGVVR